MGIEYDGIQTGTASSTALQYAESMGLTITSGFRDPGKNASVGGGSKSMHTTGTAYDFAGSPSQMKSFASWAKETGLYTEVLYEVDDHYDHVHIGWGEGKHADGKTFVGNGTLIDRGEGQGVTGSDIVGGNTDGLFASIVRTALIGLCLFFAVMFFLKAFPVDKTIQLPMKQIKKMVKGKKKKGVSK